MVRSSHIDLIIVGWMWGFSSLHRRGKSHIDLITVGWMWVVSQMQSHAQPWSHRSDNCQVGVNRRRPINHKYLYKTTTGINMIDVAKYLDVLDQLPSLEQTIDNTIQIEGDYVDNPDDPGGATRWGVTKHTARRNGYQGDMRDLPINFARAVYVQDYVFDPGFHRVMEVNHHIAEEMIDTGINAGTNRPTKWLQIALNAFNQKGTRWRDISTDGIIGNQTLSALRAYLDYRTGSEGVNTLLKALDCQQGAYYLDLAAGNDRFETFTFGWITHRIGNVEL